LKFPPISIHQTIKETQEKNKDAKRICNSFGVGVVPMWSRCCVCAVGYNNNNTRPGQYRKSPVMGAQTLFHDLSLCVCVFVVVFFSVFPNLTYILPHLSLIEGQTISDKRDNLFGIFSRCCLVPYYFVEISFLLSYIRDVIIPSIDRNKKRKTTMRVCVCVRVEIYAHLRKKSVVN
jgi:hypothetical protein